MTWHFAAPLLTSSAQRGLFLDRLDHALCLRFRCGVMPSTRQAADEKLTELAMSGVNEAADDGGKEEGGDDDEEEDDEDDDDKGKRKKKK